MSPLVPLRGSEAPRNTVILGDCVKVMATLPPGSVDLIVTDPPYAVRYRSRNGERLLNDDRVDWLEPAYCSMARVLHDDALCLSFYGWHQPDAFTQAWKAAGLQVVGHLVFPKRYVSSTRYVANSHEQAVLLAKGRPPLPRVPARDICRWHYTGNRRHPTEKSPQILAPYIEAFSPEGGLVLDPFCGSGSTLRAAHDLGRDYLGIEMDPRHRETAYRRMLA
ncbi:DNA methyltransferase [Jiella marina]|uniref:DNA methyltransferase n=1 Tax=Jiella sp. LLJ827 TaxID=2917712 RepID=UPI002100D3D4|nr:DNA methyltransferase [Jiella sp. LLJ827]MCQ0990540.1 DNA methyltransferase [Jiella sp. LLJ827]